MTRERPARLGLFVEGTNTTSSRGWDALRELWLEMCALCGLEAAKTIVHGFHKGQIVVMAERPGLRIPAAEPLDVKIARAHKQSPFDVLVIAFDAMPPNQEIVEGGCLEEIKWMLEMMVARRHLPTSFLADATLLLAHYRQNPRPARLRKHSPRIDALFMEPEFEALVVHDERLVKQAFSVPPEKRREWPDFALAQVRPKEVFAKAIGCASRELHGRIRGDAKSNRHAWALQVVRHADAGTSLKRHGIMKRLQVLLP